MPWIHLTDGDTMIPYKAECSSRIATNWWTMNGNASLSF